LDPEESIGGKLGSAIAIKLFGALQETKSTLLAKLPMRESSAMKLSGH
jgi:hypothetical protein